MQGDSPDLVFSFARFRFENVEIFSRSQLKLEDEIEKKRWTWRKLSSLKRMMTMLEMTKRGVSDYESNTEMRKK